MNLVDKLIKMDAKKAEELQTGSVESKRLAKLLGVDKVEVQIREIKSRRVNDIVAYQIDQKGKFDYSKSYDDVRGRNRRTGSEKQRPSGTL